jgi:ketosteroid isomerase-like protein
MSSRKFSFLPGLVGMVLVAFTMLIISCKTPPTHNAAAGKQAISTMLDSFNVAAAQADFSKYFSYYTEDAIFMGTDATERWEKPAFMAWSKPFFDRGKAWNFTALQRQIYFDQTGNLAWFDELLKTQMKICRGSGVVVRTPQGWKLKQYVLSMTLPNSLVDTVVAMKAPVEDSFISSLSAAKPQ